MYLYDPHTVTNTFISSLRHAKDCGFRTSTTVIPSLRHAEDCGFRTSTTVIPSLRRAEDCGFHTSVTFIPSFGYRPGQADNVWLLPYLRSCTNVTQTSSARSCRRLMAIVALRPLHNHSGMQPGHVEGVSISYLQIHPTHSDIAPVMQKTFDDCSSKTTLPPSICVAWSTQLLIVFPKFATTSPWQRPARAESRRW